MTQLEKKTNLSEQKSRAKLPLGSMGLPFVGETLEFLFDSDFILKRRDRYGSIFKSHILGKPTVFMTGSEAVRFVISSPVEHFSWRDGVPQQFRTLLGNGLPFQDGEDHRRNRQLIMPALHGRALNNYIETMQAITFKYLAKWERQQEFTWHDQYKQLTFEIASHLLLGATDASKASDLSQLYTTLLNGTFALVRLRLPGTRFGKALAAREALLQHLQVVIHQRQEHPTNDVLSLLIQARDQDGNGMSQDELMDQALILLLAGHETTASMITWLCLELARHPKVLQKAREEQHRLVKLGSLDLEQIKQMTYLDQVMQETERLHPPVPGGFRGVVKPFEFNGFYIPAGWRLYFSILDTHQTADLYPEPERFDPERFSPEQAAKYPPYSLIGFGGGSRTCLGIAFAKLEMKIILAHLLRGYQWELLAGQSFAPVRPSSYPKDGLRVKFQPQLQG
jgi:cytochrome P450